MKKKLLLICTFLMLFLIGLFGCSIGPSNQPINFQLSITDAPTEEDLQEAWIDIDRIEVSKANKDAEDEWIVVNSDGGKVNLLELTNGRIHDLVVANLESGHYNQIRFYIARTWVKVNDEIHEVHLASNTIKFVSSFTITEGITKLLIDFDLARSLKRIGGRNRRENDRKYVMTPVTRIIGQLDDKGAIKGRVVDPTGVQVTVSANRDDGFSTSTISYRDGNFLIGYLDPGTYDIVLEADGYAQYIKENVTVEMGSVVDIGEISLTAVAGNVITVDVIYSSASLDGSPVYVTSFKKGGNIPQDVIETQTGTLISGSTSVTLDNFGTGYDDGIYDVRAHIDFDRDGELHLPVPSADYITLGDVIISGSSVDVTLDGPWGTYFPLKVEVSAPSDTDGKFLHMILVLTGNTWGNYTFASKSIPLPVNGEITLDGWGPYGYYSFHAMIDMNGSFESTSVGPDTGDYISSAVVSWFSGIFPKQQLTLWTKY